MKTVLITSVGTIGATSMIFCLESLRAQIRIVGVNTLAESPGNFLCDRAYRVPETAEEDAYRTALGDIIEREQPALVAAGRDEELYVLGCLREEGTHSGTQFLVPPAALTPVFNDKYESARFAQRHGLPFADTAYEVDEAEALIARHGWPVIAKPRWGGDGSKDVFLISNDRELEAVLAARTFLIQELLFTERLSHSIDTWRDRCGMPWLWSVQDTSHQVDLVLGQDGSIISSSMVVGCTDGALYEDVALIDNNRMREVAEGYAKILGHLGHQGPLNLQGKLLPDGRYVPFELNARFTGSAIGRAQLGNNHVLAAFQHWLKITTPAHSPRPTMVRRFPMFLSFEQAWCEELSRTGQWSRPGNR
jgi:carbamoylphosphate synthase large subunit